MIDPGTYRARAMGSTPPYVQFGMASTGNEQVAVTFLLLQEVLDDNGQPTDAFEPTGEEITWVGTFTEKTMARTCESLRLAGWSTNDLEDMTGLGTTDVDLVVEHEEYQGKTRAKVAWVNKPGGTRFKFKDEIPQASFMDLRKRVKAHMLSSGGGQQRPAAPSQRQPQGRAQSGAQSPHRRPAGSGYLPPQSRSNEWDGTGPDPNGNGRDDDLPF